MKHKRYIFSVAIVIVVALIAVVLVSDSNHSPLRATTLVQAKVKSSTTKQTCLLQAASNVSAADQSALETTAIDHIFDVPAGTNANVFVATDDGSQASGSLIYAGKYGSYNFTAQHTGKTTSTTTDGVPLNGGWEISSFMACR